MVNEKAQGDFLPNLCDVKAVFFLVLMGELLGLALLADDMASGAFSGYQFGLVSLMIQWVMLSGAALLCRLRPWLKQRDPRVAGSISYGLVLLLTLFFSLFGEWALTGSILNVRPILINNMLVAAIVAGVVLRYLYLQAQLGNQQHAELQSRIQALQARIRPHFLFNSMNTIASLIPEDAPLAEKMIVNFSGLLRASLNEPTLVPLVDEIQLCRRFVEMEQLRLGARLSVVWDVALHTDEVTVPSLLLQPLIENAIYHGVQPRIDGGEVRVNVAEAEQYITIVVSNPVLQFSTEIESDAYAEIGEKSQKGNGIALDNIRHRLHAYYEGQAKVSVSELEGIYCICIRYPLYPVSQKQRGVY